jgi:hypothetical protein
MAWGSVIVVAYAALLLTAFLIGPVQPYRPVCAFGGSGSGQTARGDTSHFQLLVSTAPPTGFVLFTDRGPATPVRLKSVHVATLSCSPNAAAATVTGTAALGVRLSHSVGFELHLAVLNTTNTSASLQLRLTSGYDSGTEVLTSATLLLQNHHLSRHVVVSANESG